MAIFHVLLIFLLLVMGYNAKSITNMSITDDPIPEKTRENYRLRTDVFAKHYRLVNIVIGLNSDEIDKEIILNAKGLQLRYVTLYQSDMPNKPLLNITHPYYNVTQLDRVVLNLKEKEVLNKNCSYVIRLDYYGNLQEEMHGFYLSSYKDKNNQNQWLATTQFETVHAREVFPCFDEPAFKATFDIEIIHPEEYYALSNEDVVMKTPIGERLYHTFFKRTPLMSTYLLAFTVSKFTNISASNSLVGRNTVWSRPTFINQGQYSFNVAPKIIKEVNDLTNISYTTFISKLDQIAIPDLMTEAMENWGLVTYREYMLLWNNESTTRSKQSIATVIAHELAHMWFGNLVTLKWWSVAWLNEGFAQYFEYFAADQVENQWELDKQFVVEQHQLVLKDDSLLASHPLTLEEDKVLTPNEIASRFDSISYTKGASIIRMMKQFIGEENFTAGIRKYLAHNQQRNIEPKDLWNAFECTTESLLPKSVTLETIMKTWTEQAGFPVIFVETEQNKTNNTILNQKRFFSHEINETTENSILFKSNSEKVIEKEPPTWYVPISFTTSEEKRFDKTGPDFWLKPEDKNYTLENVLVNESSWIILNTQCSAFIRVNYSEQLWKALENAMKKPGFDGIHVLSRSQIVDDSMNLARAGEIPYATAFDILFYLENEKEYYPWYSAFAAFEYLKLRFDQGARVTKLLSQYIKDLMKQLYDNVQKNDKPTHIDTLKKVLALSWACELDNGDCVNNAEQLFKSFLVNNTRIEPDQRKVVYCTALRNSKNNEDWEFLKNRLNKTQSLIEISTIISALGCSRNTSILNSYLEYSINPALGIRNQDAQSVFEAVVSGGPDGPSIAFAFLQKNVEKMKHSYGGTGALSSVLIHLSEHLRDETQIRIFEEFIKTTDLGEANETVNDAIERSTENLEWRKKYSSDILKYLENHVVIPEPTTTKHPVTTIETSLKTTITDSTEIPSSTSTQTPTTEESKGTSSISICNSIFILIVIKTIFNQSH